MMCLRELVAERESHACGVINIHYMFSIAILGFVEDEEEVDSGSVEQCAESVHR